ncbi:MAG: hypothetical protein P8X53_12845 [Chromatiales bacterium]
MDRLTRQARMRRLFTEGFAAIDIAEPLYSVDGVRESRVAAKWMDESGLDLVGVRRNGVVVGYARRENLANGSCLDHVMSVRTFPCARCTSRRSGCGYSG